MARINIYRSRFPKKYMYKHTARTRPRPVTVPAPTDHVRAREVGKLGVIYDCPWDRLNVGWDILARRYARAMREAGLDVRHYPTAHAPLPVEVAHEVGPHSAKINVADVYVWSTFFAKPSLLTSEIKARLLSVPDVPRVFYTMFERTRAHASVAQVLNRLHGVWVPCSANQRALAEAGVKNARWVPVPWFDDDPFLKIAPAKSVKKFYWIGAWEARKAPENLIRAFFMAFRPGEAHLTLKSATAQRDWPPAEVFISDYLNFSDVSANGWTTKNWQESIKIDRRVLTRAQMVQLHAAHDCYVSASRGEGVDMPLLEAKLARRRVVTTDSGGPMDFVGINDIVVHRSREVPVHRSYDWEPNATNGDYSIDTLAGALIRARREECKNELDWPREMFHSAAVGDRLRAWFEEISK